MERWWCFDGYATMPFNHHKEDLCLASFTLRCENRQTGPIPFLLTPTIQTSNEETHERKTARDNFCFFFHRNADPGCNVILQQASALAACRAAPAQHAMWCNRPSQRGSEKHRRITHRVWLRGTRCCILKAKQVEMRLSENKWPKYFSWKENVSKFPTKSRTNADE